MTTPVSFSSLGGSAIARLCLVFFVAFAAAPLLSAFDLSGTYSDKGIVVSSEDEGLKGEPSLNAILNLDFAGQNESHAKAAELKFEESENALRIEVFDREDVSLSKTTWLPEDGFAKEENRRVLILRSRDSGATRYLLQFVPVADGKLLEVTVAKVSATAFGPVTKNTGVYVFPKL